MIWHNTVWQDTVAKWDWTYGTKRMILCYWLQYNLIVHHHIAQEKTMQTIRLQHELLLESVILLLYVFHVLCCILVTDHEYLAVGCMFPRWVLWASHIASSQIVSQQVHFHLIHFTECLFLLNRILNLKQEASNRVGQSCAACLFLSSCSVKSKIWGSILFWRVRFCNDSVFIMKWQLWKHLHSSLFAIARWPFPACTVSHLTSLLGSCCQEREKEQLGLPW